MAYIVHCAGETIYGVGNTEDEAWEDAYRSANQDGDYESLGDLMGDEDFDVSPCSAALAEEAKGGGATGWRFVKSVAITKEEWKAL